MIVEADAAHEAVSGRMRMGHEAGNNRPEGLHVVYGTEIGRIRIKLSNGISRQQAFRCSLRRRKKIEFW